MWFLVSLFTAISSASVDAWSKRFFGQEGILKMALAPCIYSLPMLFITIFLIPLPGLNKGFWVSLILGLPINIISYFLYMKAILVSPLSLSLPFLSLTPAFMIFTGYFILGEKVSISGAAGIILVVIGGYVLNVTPGMKDPFLPFKRFLREKGSMLMTVVSLLFSLGAVIGKLGIINSSPLFFGCVFFISQNLLLILFLGIKGEIKYLLRPNKQWKLFIVGLFYYFHIFFHNYAISMTQAAYMITVKRLSILFGLIYGALLFKEENLRYRLIGTLIMVSGAALIGLFS